MEAIFTVCVYSVDETDCKGAAIETEEMRPKWWDTKVIPYSKMWPDDIIWLPHFLQQAIDDDGKSTAQCFAGRFRFKSLSSTDIIDQEFRTLERHQLSSYV